MWRPDDKHDVNCGLVSLRETSTHRALLEEAVSYADGTGADLVLLWHLDEEEYDADVEQLESIGRVENVDYDHSSVVEGAAADAKSFAEPLIAETGIDVHIAVSVDNAETRGERILDTANEQGCDHVFVVGASRSPTGKAIFGDIAQKVALRFDGFTTMVTT